MHVLGRLLGEDSLLAHGRVQAWVTLVAASGLGGTAGVVAAIWLPAWAAVVVGTIGAGMAGTFSARAQEAINSGRDRRAQLVRVRTVDDPVSIGVHPAAVRRGTGRRDRVPDFVPRDCFAELRRRTRAGGFILVIGESTAGKSRLAFEAMRIELPDHRFCRPFPGRLRSDLSPVLSSRRGCVVWLDELDQYLGAGGLDVELVNQLLNHRPQPVTIMATMRVREYDRYSARNRDASDAATWRAGRDVLLLAGDPLELSRDWSPTELLRAHAITDDLRVIGAVEQAARYGVAEFLAAGPELVADWRRAQTVGAHPRGAALVAAGVDCRRMGIHRPIPQSTLVALHGIYVAPSVRQLESIADAIAWATTLTCASSSLLTVDADQGLLAFDYLIDQPFLPPVPDASWPVLLADLTPAEAYDMGWAATDLQRPDHALPAFDVARQHNVENASYAYLIAWGNSGRPGPAADQLRAVMEERTKRLGPEHPETLQAHHDYGRYLGESGRAAEAAQELLQVHERRRTVFGADHPATMTSREYEARYLGESGDCATAVQLLQQLAIQQARVLGPRHLDTLLTKIEIARYTAKGGEPNDTIAQLVPLIAEIDDQFGANSPFALSARYEYARAIGSTGDRATAVALLTDLLSDQQRILGPEQPRIFSTRHQIARLIGEAGDPATAAAQFADLVAKRTTRLGPTHGRTIASRIQHARFVGLSGDPSHARDLLEEIHQTCEEFLGADHPLCELAITMQGTFRP